MNGRLFVLALSMISGTAFATGSVECQGKLGQDALTLSWGTSHMEGAPMISPFTLALGKGRAMKICDAAHHHNHHYCDRGGVPGTTVGYWVSADRILISVLDDNAQQNILRLESGFDKKKKSYTGRLILRAPLVEKEINVEVTCDQS